MLFELLKSNKNTVVLEDNQIIKKTIHENNDFQLEVKYYKYFEHFLYIPKLIDINSEKQTSSLEYIEGKSIYELTEKKQLLLADTLAHFHKYSMEKSKFECLVHGDTNLNNYIYANDQIYMFDLADIRVDHPLTDVFSILLFFAELHTTNVFYNFYKEFYKRYKNFYKRKITYDIAILEREIRTFLQRRVDLQKGIKNVSNFEQNVEMLVNHMD